LEAELGAASGFAGAEVRNYTWDSPYTTEDYVRLLRTHSDHVVLEAERRDALLAAVGDVIDRHGGVLEMQYVSTLAMARSAGGKATEAG
jgi:hypothetical protein